MLRNGVHDSLGAIKKGMPKHPNNNNYRKVFAAKIHK